MLCCCRFVEQRNGGHLPFNITENDLFDKLHGESPYIDTTNLILANANSSQIENETCQICKCIFPLQIVFLPKCENMFCSVCLSTVFKTKLSKSVPCPTCRTETMYQAVCKPNRQILNRIRDFMVICMKCGVYCSLETMAAHQCSTSNTPVATKLLPESAMRMELTALHAPAVLRKLPPVLHPPAAFSVAPQALNRPVALGVAPPAFYTPATFGMTPPGLYPQSALDKVPPAPHAPAALGVAPPAPHAPAALGAAPPTSHAHAALGVSPRASHAPAVLGVVPPASHAPAALGVAPPAHHTPAILGVAPPATHAPAALGALPPSFHAPAVLGVALPASHAPAALGVAPTSLSHTCRPGCGAPSPSCTCCPGCGAPSPSRTCCPGCGAPSPSRTCCPGCGAPSPSRTCCPGCGASSPSRTCRPGCGAPSPSRTPSAVEFFVVSPSTQITDISNLTESAIKDILQKPLNTPLSPLEERLLTYSFRRKLSQAKSDIIKFRPGGQSIAVQRLVKARKSSSLSRSPLKWKRARLLEKGRKYLSGEENTATQMSSEIKRIPLELRTGICSKAGVKRGAHISKHLALAMKSHVGLTWNQRRHLQSVLKTIGITQESENKQRDEKRTLLGDHLEAKSIHFEFREDNVRKSTIDSISVRPAPIVFIKDISQSCSKD